MVVYDTQELKEKLSEFQRNYSHMITNYKRGVYNGLEVEQIIDHMDKLNKLFEPIKSRKMTSEELEDNKCNNDIIKALIPLAMYLKMNAKKD